MGYNSMKGKCGNVGEPQKHCAERQKLITKKVCTFVSILHKILEQAKLIHGDKSEQWLGAKVQEEGF